VFPWGSTRATTCSAPGQKLEYLSVDWFGYSHMTRFYTRMKTVTTRWPASIRAGAQFVMPTSG